MDNLNETPLGGRYTIEREIGRGGMAAVWLASDAQHDRKVAVKTLHPELAGAIGVDRFLRELRLTARLQHPNIVPILDSGELRGIDGTRVPWFAMPYLAGESLRSRLRREQQLPIDEALRITQAVGSALETAHAHQVVHRDIKPENIFLSGGHVYVVDFGIAKALDSTGAERLTSTGLAIGTPAYMSPEQCMAGTVDARSDQYSLATVLYEMLAGEPPFTGPTPQAIFARRLTEAARPLAPVRSTVPTAVERATLRALERTPADRFESIADFLSALSAREPAPLRPRRLSVHAAVLIGAVGAVVVVTLLMAWSLASRGSPRNRAVDPDVLALYRQGMRAYDRRTPAGIVEAVEAFRAALGRDSSFALAWSALAKTYSRAHSRTFDIPDVPREQLLTLGVQAADRSLDIDSLSADAWHTRGMLSFQIDPTDPAPALRYYRRSLSLDSTTGPTWHSLAIQLADSGNLGAALEAWRTCVRVDPRYAEGVAFLALGHYWRHDYDSAAFWADSALRLDPNFLLARQTAGDIAIERHDFARAEAAFEAARRVSTGMEVANSLVGMAAVKARSGQRREAGIFLQRAESIAAPFDPMPLHTAVYVARVYADLGDRDRAVATLRRFEPLQHRHFQLHIRCDPPFAALVDDPRYRTLLIAAPPPVWKGC